MDFIMILQRNYFKQINTKNNRKNIVKKNVNDSWSKVKKHIYDSTMEALVLI